MKNIRHRVSDGDLCQCVPGYQLASENEAGLLSAYFIFVELITCTTSTLLSS